jgi:hypothetical protein
MRVLPNKSIVSCDYAGRVLTGEIVAQNDENYLICLTKNTYPWRSGEEKFINKNDPGLMARWVPEPVCSDSEIPKNITDSWQYPPPYEIQQTEWYKLFFSWWK